MRLSDYSFVAPQEVWAQFPAPLRDDARLLVLHKSSGEIEHKRMLDLVDYFTKGDCLVLNDTYVMSCAFTATKDRTNASIRVYLQRDLGDAEHKLWDALMTPARKVRIGNKVYFDRDPSIVGEIIDNVTSRGRMLRFHSDYQSDFLEHLFSIGDVPVPTYIERPLSGDQATLFAENFPDSDIDALDHDRLQTVVANPAHCASVEPCAGALNLSHGLLTRLQLNDVFVDTCNCTIGSGMNEIPTTEDLFKHKMPADHLMLDYPLTAHLRQVYSEGGFIVATGVEVLRAVEECMSSDIQLNYWDTSHYNFDEPHVSFDAWTNTFIKQDYTFHIVKALLCGFYEPYTPSLIAQCTFGGYQHVMRAYNEAIKEGYHFGVYGDEMLILPD